MRLSFHVDVRKPKCTYFFFSGSHLSFPLHLTSGNTCKLSGHSSGAVDWNGMPLRSFYWRDDLYGCDALVSRLLCDDLYFGPFGSGIHRGVGRICCWGSDWICCGLCGKPQGKVAQSLQTWHFVPLVALCQEINTAFCVEHSNYFFFRLIYVIALSEWKMSAVSRMCCPVCMCQVMTFQCVQWGHWKQLVVVIVLTCTIAAGLLFSRLNTHTQAF